MDTRLSFNLNGKDVTLNTDPLRRLIDVLREDFGLTGVKEGCSEGECGACSVLLNNRMVTSCIIPVGAVDGQKVMTIEGLRETPKGKTIIDAFADGGAVQCGFCIPGMVIAAYCILERNPDPSEEEIRLGISGNICRCTGYDLIVESIRLAAKKGESLWKK
ncbi:MAG: (2Fe-2S)-binding protein [Spirochaetales bacterium]|nr:(2Fe-2S)-binding protein [Spirochaetales bacterium]